jgi:2-oxoglutarate ferredoxin oxidoreductase subunit beta
MVDYESGQVQTIELHDGSHLILKKIDQQYDPTDQMAAICLAQEARDVGQVVTGLIYYNPKLPNLRQLLSLSPVPLIHLPPEKLRPSRQSLDTLMAEFT